MGANWVPKEAREEVRWVSSTCGLPHIVCPSSVLDTPPKEKALASGMFHRGSLPLKPPGGAVDTDRTMSVHDVVCFQCGQSVGEPPRLNRMDGGGSCPACAERLLDMLPSIFHTPLEGLMEGDSEALQPLSVDHPGAATRSPGGDRGGL